MALGTTYTGQHCSLASALELIGERWSMLILRDAFYGVRRYNDFLVHLDAPRAVLAERLSKLTAGGVLEKRRYQDSPPRDEYVLTPLGEQLWPALHALMRWGELANPDLGICRHFHHVGCQQRLDLTGGCPDCGHHPEAADVEMTPAGGAALRTDPVSLALRESRRLLQPVHTTDAAPRS